jgi:CPA2 family monovalent cation:H+ antiporter-2
MLLVPFLSGGVPRILGSALAVLTLKTLAVLAAVPVGRIVVGRWVAPFLSRQRSVELVVLFSVIVVTAGTLIAVFLGLPLILGAFAAGLMLNGNRLTKQIDAVILPFRETFAAVFFVSLGTFIRFDTLLDAPLATAGTLVGVLVLKTAAAALALRLTGLSWPASLGMGLGLAQVGEFAFVLLSVGLDQDVIRPLTYNVMVFVAVGTLVLTPQLLRVGLRWAQRSPITEREIAVRLAAPRDDIPRAIVAGLGPLGTEVASQLETKGYDACLVDLSPVNLHPFAQQGFRTVSGNASEVEVLRRADAPNCQLAVIAVPDDGQARRIVTAFRKLNTACPILVRCRYQASQEGLRRLGATAVLSEEAEMSRPLMALVEEYTR